MGAAHPQLSVAAVVLRRGRSTSRFDRSEPPRGRHLFICHHHLISIVIVATRAQDDPSGLRREVSHSPM
jgi:hypothetical protein